jgi:hypothetical protein
MNFSNPPFGDIPCTVAFKFHPSITMKGKLVGLDDDYYYVSITDMDEETIRIYIKKNLLLKVRFPDQETLILPELRIERFERLSEGKFILVLRILDVLIDMKEKAAVLNHKLSKLASSN